MTEGPTRDDHGDTSHTDLTAPPRVAGRRRGGEGVGYWTRLTATFIGRRSDPTKWFFQGDIEYRPDQAGFKALRLLGEESPERFQTLEPGRLERLGARHRRLQDLREARTIVDAQRRLCCERLPARAGRGPGVDRPVARRTEPARPPLRRSLFSGATCGVRVWPRCCWSRFVTGPPSRRS